MGNARLPGAMATAGWHKGLLGDGEEERKDEEQREVEMKGANTPGLSRLR